MGRKSGQVAGSGGRKKKRVRRGIVLLYKRATVEEVGEEEGVEEEAEYRRKAHPPGSPDALSGSPNELPFEIVIIAHTGH